MDSLREKRIAPVKGYVTPSMRKQLELFKAQEGAVVSMSDYLFQVVEEHIAMRIAKQQIGRRTGTS